MCGEGCALVSVQAVGIPGGGVSACVRGGGGGGVMCAAYARAP